MNRVDSPHYFQCNRLHQANRVHSNHADSWRFRISDRCGPIFSSVKTNQQRSKHDASIIIHQFSTRTACYYDPSDPVHRDRDAIAALRHDIATEMRCKGGLNSFYLLISTVEVTYIYSV